MIKVSFRGEPLWLNPETIVAVYPSQHDEPWNPDGDPWKRRAAIRTMGPRSGSVWDLDSNVGEVVYALRKELISSLRLDVRLRRLEARLDPAPSAEACDNG
jgi:hypothetical protein